MLLIFTCRIHVSENVDENKLFFFLLYSRIAWLDLNQGSQNDHPDLDDGHFP